MCSNTLTLGSPGNLNHSGAIPSDGERVALRSRRGRLRFPVDSFVQLELGMLVQESSVHTCLQVVIPVELMPGSLAESLTSLVWSTHLGFGELRVP